MKTRLDAILALGRPGRETDRARTSVEFALACANELGDNIFDSCHLRAGLCRQGNGVAYHVLNNFGVMRTQIDDWLGARERAVAPAFRNGEDVQTFFEAAFDAAHEMSHSYIGTEHLLIGATVDGTKSAQLIAELGLNPRDVENEVHYLLGHRLP